MGTAVLDVFVQLLLEIWEIEKLEFYLLDDKLHITIYFAAPLTWLVFGKSLAAKK